MGLFFIDSDFNGAFNDAPPDPYYSDIGIGYFDPFLFYVFLAVMVTVVIAVAIGAYVGRRQAAMRLDEAKRRSVEASAIGWIRRWRRVAWRSSSAPP